MIAMSIPSPPPEWAQFSLGPLTIHTYALCIITGIIAATIITQRRLSRRGAEDGVVLDIILWAVPLGIVGARFYHVFTHGGDYFYPGANLWNVFAIWDGGNALYGSLIGGAVGAYIGCRRTGIRFWSFADALAPAMLVAQAIGRLGNYFNHELFGLPTTLPWGLEILPTDTMFPKDLPAGTLFHPLFLYEIIWNLVGVAIILLLERRIDLRWGRAFGVYLIWYGLGRSWLEAIRIDPTSDALFGIPANVWASFVAVGLGIVLIVVRSRQHPEPETSVYRAGREPEPALPRDADGDHTAEPAPAAVREPGRP
ncbi:prolipoprotein diacylglyceryl transferase [Microbacterium rhizomatis]|uniref:Phosphatidylglycerol--prolipoprotein diacylglyceryl transferase n=1 Tax=Microbacterium rhizomatis TaxID=1631477 RepID=A0A5J5IZW4_9MICO|nr:prolipoprotein diacylglyceryl transferase [Microbacterium rhizomatis]KAA9107597.1 prolipoprotein diacylglyceryl transferase [Microbacterium rhizomatis]